MDRFIDMDVIPEQQQHIAIVCCRRWVTFSGGFSHSIGLKLKRGARKLHDDLAPTNNIHAPRDLKKRETSKIMEKREKLAEMSSERDEKKGFLACAKAR